MNRDNPFFFSSDPYVYNPFRLLEVEADARMEEITDAAKARERLLANGFAPVDGMTVTAGEFNRAANDLRDPLKRLTFDILAHFTGSQP